LFVDAKYTLLGATAPENKLCDVVSAVHETQHHHDVVLPRNSTEVQSFCFRIHLSIREQAGGADFDIWTVTSDDSSFWGPTFPSPFFVTREDLICYLGPPPNSQVLSGGAYHRTAMKRLKAFNLRELNYSVV